METVDMDEAREEADRAAVVAAVGRSDRARSVVDDLERAGDGQSERLETGGTIDPRRLTEVFQQNHSQARNCYERARDQDSDLEGTVILRLTIDRNGDVVRADAQGRSLRSDEVNTCLEDAARDWKFSEPEGGAVKINKPFQFSPND